MNPIKAMMGVAVMILGTLTLTAQATIVKGTLCVEAHASAVSVGSPNPNYSDDCVGILEGDTGGEINYHASDLNDAKDAVHTSNDSLTWVPGAFARKGWVDRADYDFGTGSDGGLGFDLSVAGSIVTWTTTTELNGNWVVLVKQAKEVVLYMFENLVKTTTGKINLSNMHSQGFSHISLLSRDGGGGEAPIPATLLLMGLGLISLAAARRRAASY